MVPELKLIWMTVISANIKSRGNNNGGHVPQTGPLSSLNEVLMTVPGISDTEFIQLSAYVKSNYGLNLKKEKKYLILGRLQGLLMELGITSFHDYYNFLIADETGEAVSVLLDRLTTNHTFFMREADHFDYFKNTVLPYLASSRSPTRDLRIWSAGCSSGEEPYTLAMLIADDPLIGTSNWDSSILATDISMQALNTGICGIYSREQLEKLPEHWQKKYFVDAEHNKSQVIDRIRNRVVFRRFNLMNEFPFKKKFQVIFCRNVMIYFDRQTKIDLLAKFHEATENGGFLFIGHAESIDRGCSSYKYVMPAIYRK